MQSEGLPGAFVWSPLWRGKLLKRELENLEKLLILLLKICQFIIRGYLHWKPVQNAICRPPRSFYLVFLLLNSNLKFASWKLGFGIWTLEFEIWNFKIGAFVWSPLWRGKLLKRELENLERLLILLLKICQFIIREYLHGKPVQNAIWRPPRSFCVVPPLTR